MSGVHGGCEMNVSMSNKMYVSKVSFCVVGGVP